MGFGFNLFFVFILVPFTLIFTVIVLVLGRRKLLKPLAYFWIAVVGLIILSISFRLLRQKKKLTRNDIYGEYIIDRSKFGKNQANWQYNHFRFEITKQNELVFIETEKDTILKMSKVDISFLDTYRQPRINLHVDSARHHLIQENPTLYRTVWSFYYVFHSSKFGNVFFKKGKWKPIDN